MENRKSNEIKYKLSEENKNNQKTKINYSSIIKTEDDLLNHLEQLKSENRYEECIALIEQQLPSLEKNYSKEHEKFYQLAYEITDICNLKAYDLFLNSKPEEGLRFIEKSIQIFSNYKQILNICYANLGKYYIKLNKKQKAIDCFLVSTEIARSLKNKLHVAQGHLLLANVLLNTDSILLAIEQALSGIILLQEIIINKEEYKENANILEALEDAYLIVAVGKYKSGNIIQSLLYCKLAEQLREKMEKNKKEIKYKHSESNRNYSKKLISNINIQSEDDLLSKLEQLKSENKYEECISLIEQQLPYLEKNYSKESEKFYQLAYEITDICNLKAYDLFLNSKPEEGRKFIEKSIQIFSNYKQILNICYANLGKYYVKLNQRQKAIDCFIVSTEIARSLKNKLHVAQGHLLLANILLNSSSINQAIEQALSGIILLQEIIINKEEYKDNLNILEALEDAYLIVAVGKYKSGNIIQSLLYCNLAEKIQEKIGKFNKKDESNEKSNLDKKSKKSKKSKNNTSELNILEDDTKYELIKNALSFDVYQDKALFDKNEQMSYNYLINTLKKMLTEIEIKLKSKKTEGNENEFFISQMNGENNNITYYSNMDEVNK